MGEALRPDQAGRQGYSNETEGQGGRSITIAVPSSTGRKPGHPCPAGAAPHTRGVKGRGMTDDELEVKTRGSKAFSTIAARPPTVRELVGELQSGKRDSGARKELAVKLGCRQKNRVSLA